MNPHKKTKNPKGFSPIALLSPLADSDLVEHFSEELGTHFFGPYHPSLFSFPLFGSFIPDKKAEVIHSLGSFSPKNPESSEKIPSRFPEKSLRLFHRQQSLNAPGQDPALRGAGGLDRREHSGVATG